MDAHVFKGLAKHNFLYRVKVTKGTDLQTCPVFTLSTQISRKKLITIKKENGINYTRYLIKNGKSKWLF